MQTDIIAVINETIDFQNDEKEALYEQPLLTGALAFEAGAAV